MTDITDPITTAREALTPLATIQQELETLALFAAPGYGNEARRQAMILTGRFASILELAEKLKSALEVTQDEGLTEIARLTSQLDQAERVIAPFAETAVWADNNGYDIADFDMLLRGPSDTVCGHLHAQQEDFSCASQWIKDRQAKTDGSEA